MKLIAAVDKNWGIGLGGELLFRISDDLKRFRALTKGNVVIMGRKTLDTLPGGHPLDNRDNIVLSRNAGLSIPGAVVVSGLSPLFKALAQSKHQGKEVFVIGGEQVYTLLLPYCEAALITHVERAARADKYLPPLNRLEGWYQGEAGPYFGEPPHAYCTYYNANTLNYLSEC